MKRVIVLMLVCLLAVTAMPISFATAEEKVMQATIWEDFSRRNPGEKFDDSEFICTESQGSAVCVNTLSALGAVNAAKLNYSELRGYHNIGGDQGFKLVYNEPKSLKGITHIIYYVRMPVSRISDEAGNNWMKTGMAPMFYLGGYDWLSPKSDIKAQILGVNDDKWVTRDFNSIYLDLPSGFEGYIKLDLSQYNQENLQKPLGEYSVHQSIFQFSNMGGVAGAGYINAVYGVNENSNSIKVKLNGEKTARYWTTGLIESQINKKLLDKAMRVDVLQDFSGYNVGDDLLEKGVVFIDHKDDVNAKLVANSRGPLNNPVLELSSETLGGFHDSDPFYTIRYGAISNKAEDMKAILFSIKCADPYPLAPGKAAFRFNIFSEKDGQPLWSLLGSGKAKYLQKGSNQWYVPESDDNGVLYMPANFEGWIMCDISEMTMNSMYGDTDGRIMLHSTVQFQAVGGECGNSYVDGIYKIVDMENKKTNLVTFNGCDVFCLSNNTIATEDDLIVKGPEVGDSFPAIPAATKAELETKVEATTKDSCTATWNACKGATSYRVDIYDTVKDSETGSVTYTCVGTTTVNTTTEFKGTVSGLKPATRYYAIVTALNAIGETLEVYDYTRFSTKTVKKTATVNKDDDKNEQNSGTVNLGGDDKKADEENNSLLWIIIACAAAVVVIGGGVTAFIIIKKKKGASK